MRHTNVQSLQLEKEENIRKFNTRNKACPEWFKERPVTKCNKGNGVLRAGNHPTNPTMCTSKSLRNSVALKRTTNQCLCKCNSRGRSDSIPSRKPISVALFRVMKNIIEKQLWNSPLWLQRDHWCGWAVHGGPESSLHDDMAVKAIMLEKLEHWSVQSHGMVSRDITTQSITRSRERSCSKQIWNLKAMRALSLWVLNCGI